MSTESLVTTTDENSTNKHHDGQHVDQVGHSQKKTRERQSASSEVRHGTLGGSVKHGLDRSGISTEADITQSQASPTPCGESQQSVYWMNDVRSLTVKTTSAATSLYFPGVTRRDLGIGKGSSVALGYDPHRDALVLSLDPEHACAIQMSYASTLPVGRFLSRCGIRLLKNETYSMERIDDLNFLIPLEGRRTNA